MARGISLHIGLNGVDAEKYGGWPGTLVACEADANDMAALAAGRGFESTKLLTAAATSEALLAALGEAAGTLEAGDILLVTYSGHRGHMPDTNDDEQDGLDETWALYDRQVVDDELYAAWGKFKPGVRIVVVSDSCHSGTVTRELVEALRPNALSPDGNGAAGGPRMRAMPPEVADRDYRHRKTMYDKVQRAAGPEAQGACKASVLLLSGCQDNQTSQDGDHNGLFTGTLLEVWNDGKFRGAYHSFRSRIARKMPPWQSPNLFTTGEPSREFERQHPFTV